MKHNWTYNDDVVAYFICRFGVDDLIFDLNGICRKLDVKPDSMNMRIGNFKALEGTGKLINVAELSRKIYEDFKNTSKSKHIEEVKKILY